MHASETGSLTLLSVFPLLHHLSPDAVTQLITPAGSNTNGQQEYVKGYFKDYIIYPARLGMGVVIDYRIGTSVEYFVNVLMVPIAYLHWMNLGLRVQSLKDLSCTFPLPQITFVAQLDLIAHVSIRIVLISTTEI